MAMRYDELLHTYRPDMSGDTTLTHIEIACETVRGPHNRSKHITCAYITGSADRLIRLNSQNSPNDPNGLNGRAL